eukprot:TRINITY_DN7806_c0_g1_i2.p1 TRINITY_DN7806_c0_g1~~TRINITY_DN7806_c0_g1_i2.p1  ORF type:complete len:1074 (+),score=155.96 TRINITY_DN7806_c0_g1_i2:285-3224(+)
MGVPDIFGWSRPSSSTLVRPRSPMKYRPPSSSTVRPVRPGSPIKSRPPSGTAARPGIRQGSPHRMGKTLSVPARLGSLLKRVSTSSVTSHQSPLGLGEIWSSSTNMLGNNSKGMAWGESRAKQTESRQALLEMAMRRRREALDSDVMQKKANAAKAVALDRARIDEKQLQCKEKSLAEAQTRQDQERQLRRLFAPIPTPDKYLPVPWQGCDITARTIRKHSCQRSEHWANLDLDATCISVLSNLCYNFAQLLKPYREKESPDTEREAPSLTRPAFCRLLIDLNLTDSRGELLYHIALDVFDALSTQMPVKGCPTTAGLLTGIRVDEYDGCLIKLFSSLFTYISEDTGSMLTPNDLKSYVFGQLISTAEKKCRRRWRHICRHIALGKDIFKIPVVVQPPPTEKEKTLEEKSLVAVAKEIKVQSLVSTAISKFAGGRILNARRNSFRGKAGAVSANAGDRNAQAAEADNAKGGGDDCASVASSNFEERNLDEADPEATLYAHTCAVSKGEFLSNMLLEPEVLQMVWMFYSEFTTLFEVYCDESTDFLGNAVPVGGHMSHQAFLRFCIDFRLFPDLVDLNTFACLYQSAENSHEVSRSRIKRHMAKIPGHCQISQGSVVQLLQKIVAPGSKDLVVKPGDPLKVLAIDSMDIDSEAALLVTTKGKKVWAKLNEVISCEKSFFAKPCIEKEKGRDHSFRATWINKPFCEMSPAEQRSLTIISSFSEFVTSQKLRSKDFFSKFTDGDSSSLNVSDLMRGCTFMCLGGTLRTSVSTAPPSLEEVQELFTLIDTDGGGRLEYAELDLVIKLVQERKARNSRQENIFLKDTPDMTATELAARDFFVPLYKEMESRGWTAKDFMNQYDSDAGGELSGRELISAAKDLGLTMNENVVNNFDRALMLLDRDFNGALNTQELENILRFVRDSTLDGDAAASSIPNPFAAEVQQAEASAEKQKESMFRVFGLKAFIECLLKILSLACGDILSF